MCVPHNETIDRLGADETSKILALLTAGLSVFGSLFIIVSFCVWKDLRTVSRQILVYISIADFLTSGGNLFGAATDDHHIAGRDVCAEQSLVTTTGCLSFIMWTTILSVYLYMSIVHAYVHPSCTVQGLFAFFGWGVPLAVGLSAYLFHALGDDESAASAGWCWLRPEPKYPESLSCYDARLMWSLLTAKGWEIPSYVVVPVLYYRAKRHISKEVR